MRIGKGWLVAMLGSVASCSEASTARPQVLLVIDTNLPVVGQGDDRSRAAAVDAVRIDVLSDGAIAASREIVAADVRDWPISLGLLPTTNGVATLRVRAFRSSFSRASQDRATREPLPEVTVDRVVSVTFPVEGVRRLRVRLDGDCFGRPSSFFAPASTCIDGATTSGDPGAGIETLADDAPLDRSDIGSWRGAAFTPCTASQPADDAVCVPGGFAILGDQTVDGVDGLAFTVHDAVPLRPVALSPFYMDRHEVTVGRIRRLGPSALVGVTAPLVSGAGDAAECTFRGWDDASNDALPINCVTLRTAKHVCALFGGSVPTEAQWEYAARGRGEQRAFPWGAEESFGCCTLSFNRRARVGLDCGDGVEPVGSHADPSKCRGPVDVSRDGIRDLGGSMRELVVDSLERYDAPCWGGPGITVDPMCSGGRTHVVRGGAWDDSTEVFAFAAVRSSASDTGEVDPSYGFRCVYPGIAP